MAREGEGINVNKKISGKQVLCSNFVASISRERVPRSE